MGKLSPRSLVGGFNPLEKYARQIGSSTQVGVKIKMFETTTYITKFEQEEETLPCLLVNDPIAQLL